MNKQKSIENNSIAKLAAVLLLIVILLQYYQFQFYELTLNPERMMVLPLSILTGLSVLLVMRLAKLPQSHYLLLLWLIVGFISSVVSEVNEWSLRMFVSLLIACAYYYMVLILGLNPAKILRSKSFYVVSWILGPCMVLLYFFSITEITLPESLNDLFSYNSGGQRIHAGFYEPNLYGAYLSLFILVTLAYGKLNSFSWWLLLIGLHLGLVLSFSRMPWFAYVCSLFIYFILIRPKKYTLNAVAIRFIYLVFTLIFVIILSYIIYRLYGDNEIIGRTHSASSRFVMWSLAVQDIKQNLILGSGVFSFSAIHPYAPSLVGSETHHSAWVSNLFLSLLHDTGIIGFVLLLSFFAIVLFSSWITVRSLATQNRNNVINTRMGAALLASLISLMISSMTIPSHSLAFFWVMIAFMQRYVLINKQVLKANV